MRIIILFLGLTFFSTHVIGQIKVKQVFNVKKLVQETFGGKDIEIVDVKVKGRKRAFGHFVDKGVLHMHEGVILSTGKAKNANGPNNSTSKSTRNRTKGDHFLRKIAKVKTYDAAIVEIKFIPKSTYISFNYVFASEEYIEYSHSVYNDVFAFLLKAKRGRAKNLAHIPNSKSIIAVNKINHEKNAEYYINNSHLFGEPKAKLVDTVVKISNHKKYVIVYRYKIEQAITQEPSHPIQFDGFTKVLQAKSKVKPGKVYTLKIMIADAGDRILDSGVFIEKGSFNSHDSESFKYGTLAKNEDYYYEIDTIQTIDLEEEIDTVIDDLQPPICTDHKLSFYFEKNKTECDVKMKTINSIRAFLNENTASYIVIYGYTDSKGNEAYNKGLSEQRVKYIQDALISAGCTPEQIKQMEGKGEAMFLYSNETKQGRDKNRRVEVILKCP